MVSAWLVSMAMSTTMVPPGQPLQVNHAHPAHGGQPVIVVMDPVRRDHDRLRRNNWNVYCEGLDAAWAKFRADGSTDVALKAYKVEVNRLKYKYLNDDPYLVPIVDNQPWMAPYYPTDAQGSQAGNAGCPIK